MKKISAFIIALLTTLGAFSQGMQEGAAPDFTMDNSYVIDMKASNLKYRDYFKVRLCCNASNSFEVYGNNPSTKEWIKLGGVQLAYFGDEQTVRFPDKAAKKWRYYAVVSSKNLKYTCQPIAKNNDLIVCMRYEDDDINKEPLPKINVKDAVVYSIKKYDAEDFVRFRNMSSTENLTFNLYVMEKNHGKWSTYGTAKLLGYKDQSTIDNAIDIEDVNYIAIEPKQTGYFEYKLEEDDDDLYINVTKAVLGSETELDINDINAVN